MKVNPTDSINLTLKLWDEPQIGKLSRLFLWRKDSDMLSYQPNPNREDSLQIESFPIPIEIIEDMVSAMVVDKAGNFCKDSVTIQIVSDLFGIKISLYDSLDITDSLFTKGAGLKVKMDITTNNAMVNSFILAQNYDFSDGVWLPIPSNFETYYHLKTSQNGDGRYKVFTKCKDEYNVESRADSSSIWLDTTYPSISDIEIKSESGQDIECTDSKEVIVHVEAADVDSGKLKKLYLSEDQFFDQILDSLSWKEGKDYMDILVEFSGDTGMKVIYARVEDMAEHFTTDSRTFFYDPIKKVYNIPNPFHPPEQKTKIIVKSKDLVSVMIYDAFGNLVRKLQHEPESSERQEIEWDGKNGNGDFVADGVYIAVIRKDSSKPEKIKIAVIKR